MVNRPPPNVVQIVHTGNPNQTWSNVFGKFDRMAADLQPTHAPPLLLRWTRSKGVARAWNFAQKQNESFFEIEQGSLRWYDRESGAGRQLLDALDLSQVKRVFYKRGTITLVCSSKAEVFKLVGVDGSGETGDKVDEETATRLKELVERVRALSADGHDATPAAGGRGEFEHIGETLRGRATARNVKHKRSAVEVYVCFEPRFLTHSTGVMGTEMGVMRLAHAGKGAAEPRAGDESDWLVLHTGAKALRFAGMAQQGLLEVEVWLEQATTSVSGGVKKLEAQLHLGGNDGGVATLSLDVGTTHERHHVASFLESHLRYVVPRALHPSPGLHGLFRPDDGDEVLCDRLLVEVGEARARNGPMETDALPKPTWVAVHRMPHRPATAASSGDGDSSAAAGSEDASDVFKVTVYEHLGDDRPLRLWPLRQLAKNRREPAAEADEWRTTLLLDASCKVSSTWHPRRRIDIAVVGHVSGNGAGGNSAGEPPLQRLLSLQARDNAQHDLWLSGLMHAKQHERVYHSDSAVVDGSTPAAAMAPSGGSMAQAVATAMPIVRGSGHAFDHGMRTRGEGDDILQALVRAASSPTHAASPRMPPPHMPSAMHADPHQLHAASPDAPCCHAPCPQEDLNENLDLVVEQPDVREELKDLVTRIRKDAHRPEAPIVRRLTVAYLELTAERCVGPRARPAHARRLISHAHATLASHLPRRSEGAHRARGVCACVARAQAAQWQVPRQGAACQPGPLDALAAVH